MTGAYRSPYRRHRELAGRIEREFPVADWRVGDVDLWPILSQDLFLDIFRRDAADTMPPPPMLPIRAATTLAAPAMNLWRSRQDLAHCLTRPHRADAIFLGDGVSLDFVDGSWRDRFAEPVIAAYERQGRPCFAIQSGNLTRLPWARPTYAANQIAARAAVAARFAKSPEPDLPDHGGVMSLLRESEVAAPSLMPGRVDLRARTVAAQAAEFERVLDRVQPSVAFIVTYYAGLGHAFALACRRRRIFCVDLQHCPHDGVHRAYRWSTLPPHGYSTLPSAFWTWSKSDAARIDAWTGKLSKPWHCAIAGGHTQIASLDRQELERLWGNAVEGDRRYEREILVALQPIGGKSEKWKSLADQIAKSPPDWRWWIRRHPASTADQDKECAPLPFMDRPNVTSGNAAQIPLPALLAHMDALVSLASGAAGEAEIFGVPAFFLDLEASDTFPELIDRGKATITLPESLLDALRRLPRKTVHRHVEAPELEETLREIDVLAASYSRLFSEAARDEIDRAERVGTEREAPCAA